MDNLKELKIFATNIEWDFDNIDINETPMNIDKNIENKKGMF